nr:glutamate racemase [Lysinibacter cavernae]
MPIGIFDSGVGGLTVARAVRDQLPRESITYVGDTAHSPYGPKPIADVREYALSCLDDLVDQGVKMLVIACNTASAAMLRDAHERYDVPVLEVIQPAVRSAVQITRNQKVGLIGTVGTINSRAYDDLFSIRSDIELYTKACPRFVEFVEAGVTSSPELLAVAEEYLGGLRDHHIDTLVLGCTHYPFLRGAISQVMGNDVVLVSSDIETANDVYKTLVDRGLQRSDDEAPSYQYRSTGDDPEAFYGLAQRLLGNGLQNANLQKLGDHGFTLTTSH